MVGLGDLPEQAQGAVPEEWVHAPFQGGLGWPLPWEGRRVGLQGSLGATVVGSGCTVCRGPLVPLWWVRLRRGEVRGEVRVEVRGEGGGGEGGWCSSP